MNHDHKKCWCLNCKSEKDRHWTGCNRCGNRAQFTTTNPFAKQTKKEDDRS